MGLISMSIDLVPESEKRKIIAKPFKIWKITYNSEATISNCNTIQTEDNT